ncbi:Protein of unknown function (DUF2567) [Saccharomonospora marina XMU15]|uniref:DUF2567 domain-containing protein n=1 Tax=Saccharomonospora marina XMU15 TaxID=882083 RepID=H5X1H4_9PSEU|nr:Protein of unknown function (DUF2567) [Saccharomonospora marina XMU15]
MPEQAEQADIALPPPAQPAVKPAPVAGVTVRADLLPAVSVMSLVGLLGIPLGWLWALLAPTQRMRVVTEEGRLVPLQLESWHRFEDMAIFLLLGLSAGLVVGSVVWLLRQRRGPVTLLAVVGGSLLAAWLAMRLGTAFADARYPVPESPGLGAVVERAPVLESRWVLLAQPMTAALAYGVLAAWYGHDDLGRRLA